jgi:GxxExxY protein
MGWMKIVPLLRWLIARLRFTKSWTRLLESVYEVLLADALRERGFSVERQKPIPIRFRGKRFDEGFRADLVVGEIVLVELKSLESLCRVHKNQVLTYLRLSHLKLGLLINFGGELLKGNIDAWVDPALQRSRASK